MGTPDLSQYLTTRQAAWRLGLSKSSVDQYARRGDLPSFTIGTARVFLVIDVDAFAKKPRPRGNPEHRKNKEK